MITMAACVQGVRMGEARAIFPQTSSHTMSNKTAATTTAGTHRVRPRVPAPSARPSPGPHRPGVRPPPQGGGCTEGVGAPAEELPATTARHEGKRRYFGGKCRCSWPTLWRPDHDQMRSTSRSSHSGGRRSRQRRGRCRIRGESTAGS